MKYAKLIIGNGFDIKCGLKSSYKDFFKYLDDPNQRFFEEIRKMEKRAKILDSQDEMDLSNINLWVYIFYDLRKEKIEYWMDVERVIYNCLFEENYHINFEKNIFLKF